MALLVSPKLKSHDFLKDARDGRAACRLVLVHQRVGGKKERQFLFDDFGGRPCLVVRVQNVPRRAVRERGTRQPVNSLTPTVSDPAS